MLKKDLLSKINNEEPLTELEQRLLDEALESETHQAMKAMVHAVPQEEPSMSWRSGLNGRLLEIGKSVEKKRRTWFVLRPALGLGLAGVLALVVTLNVQKQGTPDSWKPMSVEAALVDEHIEALNATEIAGAGLASHEARPTPVSATDDLYDWQPVDIESL
jgi:hypothetical protein